MSLAATATSEHPDPPELEEILRGFSGALAFDVGAHVGHTAELLSRRFGLVVACEPHPVSYAALAVRAFPGKVETRHTAVGPAGGWLPVQVRDRKDREGQYVAAAGAWPEWGAVTGRLWVPSVTVDGLAGDHGPPDLLKIDVEGSEHRVLVGAYCTLEVDRPRLFVEVHTAQQGSRIGRLLGPLYPELRRVAHPHYEPGSWHVSNHYWLVTPP